MVTLVLMGQDVPSFKHTTKKNSSSTLRRDAFLEAMFGDSLVLAWTWKETMHQVSHLLQL